MEVTVLLTVVVASTLLCPSVISLEEIQCKRGSLEISMKGLAKPIVKFNCNLKPIVATLSDKDKDGCSGNDKPKIVSRSEWGAKSEDSHTEVLPTTDCVVVDGSTYFISDSDYRGKMRRDHEHSINSFGSFFSNFHIGDDGVVYEALGWDKFFFLRSGGIKCLRIAFLKPTKEVAPTTAAINAFNELIKSALCLGKLSPSYRIIPHHYIHIHESLGPDSFERKDLMKWDRCEKNTDVTQEEFKFGNFPVVFREDWGGENAINEVLNRTNKIKYVLVGNYFERCFTSKNCMQLLKWLERHYHKKGEDFKANYLIGDDGMSYEVFPWNQTWHQYYINKDVVLVQFLGKFESYLPTERAMKAFRRLLRLGEIWGFLSQDYKIVSYRQADNNVIYIGDLLDAHVRKMDRFSSEF